MFCDDVALPDDRRVLASHQMPRFPI